uniref:Putative secreted protein n=1 Tax=Anopheles darlingi TaxID=43151 RepID=A0A2M4D040_ANODA
MDYKMLVLFSFSFMFSGGILCGFDFFQQSGRSVEERSTDVSDVHNLHDVEAYGNDFVDFGSQTGRHGAFAWHSNFLIDDAH